MLGTTDEIAHHPSFYARLASERKDSPELQAVVQNTVDRLKTQETSSDRPGVLFGRIQSGKTRAFIGIIASAFDNGFDGAIILTKGTKSLVSQTMKRLGQDFADFKKSDEVKFFDIMELNDNLTLYVLEQKLILVAKKEDDNLKRLIAAFHNTYPMLRDRRWLIVDDEADLASVTFVRIKGGGKGVGKVSHLIDDFRGLLQQSAYLQVTATPYALYLQPESDVYQAGELLFRPKRPAFTEILPSHSAYVGGEYYFEKASDPNSPAYFFYRPVPIAERDALKKEDGRRLRREEVLTSTNAAVIRAAIMNFIVGGAIRRMQDQQHGVRPGKYAFLFHTEQQRASHDWQQCVVTEIRDQLTKLAELNSKQLIDLVQAAYDDLERSLKLAGSAYPTFPEVCSAVTVALVKQHLMVTIVNSDQDIQNLLNEDGQLELQNPYNIFIGGQILDRGITIDNLIGFYYGRNPQKAQQDTVLQHSRMYGARQLLDLPVTRLYAPERIYKIMQTINDFDGALRDALEASSGDAQSVYFIMQDRQKHLVACSPNKILFSDVKALRPGRRVVPTGFHTLPPTGGQKLLQRLDDSVAALSVADNEPKLIDLSKAVDLLTQAQGMFKYGDDEVDDRDATVAILKHLSLTARNDMTKGKVWLIVAGQSEPRNLSRERVGGRLTDSPDTKQQTDAASSTADAPVLMLIKQRGEKAAGWGGSPFWWPVIVVPSDATPAIFAEQTSEHIAVAV